MRKCLKTFDEIYRIMIPMMFGKKKKKIKFVALILFWGSDPV